MEGQGVIHGRRSNGDTKKHTREERGEEKKKRWVSFFKKER